MVPVQDYESVWILHYEGEEEGEVPPETPPTESKTYSEDDLTAIVDKRTEEVRRKQKAALKKFEEVQQSLKLTNEQKTAMEAELEEFRKNTLTAEEYAKREQKKLQEQYDSQLTEAQKESQDWQSRHNQLKIGYEISSAASKYGVLPEAVEALEAVLRSKTKIVPVEGDEGIEGYQARVDFVDRTAEGKPLPVELSVEEAIKLMKDKEDQYGYMFQGAKGGLGGNSGRPGAKGKSVDFSKLSPAEYQRIRKENPELLYGDPNG